MGGQFVYYINGVDPRIQAAVAIAVAGDWHKLLFYPGSWGCTTACTTTPATGCRAAGTT